MTSYFNHCYVKVANTNAKNVCSCLPCACVPPLWKRFRNPRETSIFCLFFSACWRHNANGQSQNALPFLQHKENALCYVAAIVTNIALRWRSNAFFTHASFHTEQSYMTYRCQQCHYLAELPAKDVCVQKSHATKQPLLYRN